MLTPTKIRIFTIPLSIGLPALLDGEVTVLGRRCLVLRWQQLIHGLMGHVDGARDGRGLEVNHGLDRIELDALGIG